MLPDILQGSGGRNRLVRGRYGVILYNANDFVIGTSIAEYGEYYESEVEVFRRLLKPGDTAIDVGCNIGTHTLALARIVGPAGFVVGIDPQLEMIRLVDATMLLNGINQALLINAAAGRREGTAILSDVDYDKPRSSYGGAHVTHGIGSREVEIIALDTVFTRGRRVNLIKIDVEGHEIETLLGARQMIERDRPYLYVENDRVPKSRDLLEALAELGYRSYWHQPLFHNPDNYACRKDPIHACGLIDTGNPEYYETVGFATNMLCIPREIDLEVTGLIEATDFDWHPSKKSCVKVAA